MTGDHACRFGVWWAHKRKTFTTPRQAAWAAWGEAMAAPAAPPPHPDTKDAERYRWLRDNPLWRVTYRICPNRPKTFRMIDDEGDLWGQWWPTHEQAVDAAIAAIAASKGGKPCE